MLAASIDGFFVLAACYELTLTLCFFLFEIDIVRGK